ncbi:3-hydroxyanthranilate 3,4-dioxygenase isoform X1 [Hydra vulgaris]|uniref:3-hydroxyanthranilate 3,4-dioxygenase isoform X1 n=2 Tax=Hydra vulgaris TaxID=6087 RepID=UPI001F5E7DE0|nr:3-hydroxyanthranilate 3,4-dioxygenase isoform X1 [Hydra vulgaris]XP_047132020.1 3-hydroxyanthranilate 3,4-dioxygenase isoform X1 [Hydra vulgaris]
MEVNNIDKIVNIDQWIKENENNFCPPVCNAIMAEGFLKIMFIGGPNTRKDYHLEQGEELFYMIKGDMCLKIMLPEGPKDVLIKEGEIFLLPSCIPHSPQRFPNTIGLVVERDRSDVCDVLRYYCDDGITILWEKYFHLHSLVKDFPIIIKEFFESTEFKTGIPNKEAGKIQAFPSPKNLNFSEPIPLQEWLSKNFSAENNVVDLFNEEFKVKIYRQGTFDIHNTNETWLWLKVGNGACTIDSKKSFLNQNDSLLVSANKSFFLEVIGETSFCMVVTNVV